MKRRLVSILAILIVCSLVCCSCDSSIPNNNSNNNTDNKNKILTKAFLLPSTFDMSTAKYLKPERYEERVWDDEKKDSDHYSASTLYWSDENHKLYDSSTMKYGKNTLGELYVVGGITQFDQIESEDLYLECLWQDGTIVFGYTYDGEYQTDNKDEWNLVCADGSYVNLNHISGDIGYGTILVEKPNKDVPGTTEVVVCITDFFKVNPQGNAFFTINFDDIEESGPYIITIAYKMGRRIEKSLISEKFDKYEYYRYVEEYQIYIRRSQNS